MSFVLVAPVAPTVPVALAPRVTVPERLARWLRRSAAGHAVMVVLAAAAVLPLVWLVLTALGVVGAAGARVDRGVGLGNLAYVFETIPMAQMLANTALMTVLITLAQLLVAVLAAYGFAVFEFRGKKALYLLFVASWLVPFQVTMIPNYVLISQMGLLNSIAGIVVPNLCSAFAVLMLRQHVRALPRELLDAAAIDGRGSWATLWLVVVPNLVPALASLAVILAISAWNEYLWPTLVMQQSASVVQVGVRAFLGAEGNDWGAVMAASGLACLPVFVLYLLMQRHVVNGFVRSGLK